MLTSYHRGCQEHLFPFLGSLTFPPGLSCHTQTQGIGLGLPSPTPHTTVPTEGIILGNPKGQGQALRVAILKLDLHHSTLEGLLKHRWEQKEFLIQQAWGQEGDKNLHFSPVPGDLEAAGAQSPG